MTGSLTQLCPTLAIKWSRVYQFLLPIGLSWQEHWSGLPFPTPYLITGLCQRERRETKFSSVSESTPVRFRDIPFILSFCKGNLMSSLVAQLVKNVTDRGAWWATVHGVVKSQTLLSAHACINVFLKLHHGDVSSVPHSAMPVFIKKCTKYFLYFILYCFILFIFCIFNVATQSTVQ